MAELCECSGSTVQHTNDPEGCWCRKCLNAQARCQEYRPASGQQLLKPAKARKTDPETSHEAAAVVTPKMRQSYKAIMDAYESWGEMTDEQLYEKLQISNPMSPSGCRSRRSELVEMGQVIDTGRTAPTSRGNKAIIWNRRVEQEALEI